AATLSAIMAATLTTRPRLLARRSVPLSARAPHRVGWRRARAARARAAASRAPRSTALGCESFDHSCLLPPILWLHKILNIREGVRRRPSPLIFYLRQILCWVNTFVPGLGTARRGSSPVRRA